MANPISFKPNPVDPKLELERRLAAAPVEHGEAALVAWDVLQTAHDEGLLDLLQGLLGAKDTIAGKLAEYAKLPEGVAGIRNLLALAKILTTLDPEFLNCLANSMDTAMLEHRRELKPPSLWQIGRRVASEDSRRGLSFLTLLLSGLGRSLKD
ncbi:MAG: hypothetical protein NVSMB3_12040 [Acidobacteriaceae bacterium]